MPARQRLIANGTEWTAEAAGTEIRLSQGRAGVTSVRVILDDDKAADGRLVALEDGVRTAGVAAAVGDRVWVQVEGHVFEVRTATTGGSRAQDVDTLSPPMPATVTRIAVKVGDVVRQGDLLVALEAMKMELPIRAPRDGIVRALHCVEGDLVEPGTVLLEI
jgi:3-methylcrotonyl-CoA carboxylase alpha subunit